MKINLIKKYGNLLPYSQDDKDKIDKFADGAIYQVDIKNLDIRTIKQNSALHKYFELVSRELNDRGLTVTKTIKADIVWSPASIKEVLWKPIQEAVLKKKSTTELNKSEIDSVYDVMNMALGQKFGIHVPFPTIEK
jgi:hypothetical protein